MDDAINREICVGEAPLQYENLKNAYLSDVLKVVNNPNELEKNWFKLTLVDKLILLTREEVSDEMLEIVFFLKVNQTPRNSINQIFDMSNCKNRFGGLKNRKNGFEKT